MDYLLLVEEETPQIVKFQKSKMDTDTFREYRKLRDSFGVLESGPNSFCPRSKWSAFKKEVEALGFQVQTITAPELTELEEGLFRQKEDAEDQRTAADGTKRTPLRYVYMDISRSEMTIAAFQERLDLGLDFKGKRLSQDDRDYYKGAVERNAKQIQDARIRLRKAGW